MENEVGDGYLVHPGYGRVGDGFLEISDHGTDEGVSLLVPSGTFQQTLCGAEIVVTAVVHIAFQFQNRVLADHMSNCCVGCLVLSESPDDLSALSAGIFSCH